MNIIDDLRHITPGRGHRLLYVIANLEVLESLRENELGEVGKLLCHESSAEMKENYPIIGEHKQGKKEAFEAEVFGDPDNRRQLATYVAIPSEREHLA